MKELQEKIDSLIKVFKKEDMAIAEILQLIRKTHIAIEAYLQIFTGFNDQLEIQLSKWLWMLCLTYKNKDHFGFLIQVTFILLLKGADLDKNSSRKIVLLKHHQNC